MGVLIEDNVGMNEYMLERIHRLDERLQTRRGAADRRVPVTAARFVIAEVSDGYALSFAGRYQRTEFAVTVKARFLEDAIQGFETIVGRNFKVGRQFPPN